MNPFVWDPSVGQYRYPNGRFVARKDVRDAIDKALQAEAHKTQTIGIQLRNGTITLSSWRQGMRDIARNVHLFSAALAKGGSAQMTQADFGRVGQVLRHEYRFLDKFAVAVSQGYPLDGRFFDRALMYAQAGRDTYHIVERAVMKDAGFVYESNVLTPAEHCTGEDGCIAQTARGRVPIGELIPIGRRTCLRKCKCYLAYWKTVGDA